MGIVELIGANVENTVPIRTAKKAPFGALYIDKDVLKPERVSSISAAW